MKSELHQHQASAIERLRLSIASGHRRPMLQAPTGSGKTMLAAAVTHGALVKRKRVLFVVPAITLVDQTVQMFEEEYITAVGVMQAQHHMTDGSQPVQIASVQTLMKRTIPDADVVIIDEAHRWFEYYGKWMAQPYWAKVPFIGLSATPWTRGLGKHFDDLIVATTTRELIEQKFLSPFRVFAPDHPDLDGVRTVAGDYHEGDLSKAMDKQTLIADIVQTWIEKGEGRPTLVFGVDRAHAKNIQEKFLQAGVRTGYMDAFTEDEERRAIKKDFHNGNLQIVCNVGVLTTGVDWDVRCIILARPTKSEILYVQIIGRGLRTATGKENLLVLDHSDTTLRLGFVTDINHDALDDGTRSPKARAYASEHLPHECVKCKFVMPASAKSCPACGNVTKKTSKMKNLDGDLVEYDANHKAKGPTHAEKQKFYSGLISVGDARGHKDGWAANAYRKKFGAWPNNLSKTPAQFVDPEVLRYVKYLQIAYAKGKAKERAHA